MTNLHACLDCGAPSPTRRCDACQARKPKPVRSSTRHTGNARYRRLRAEALDRDHHTCVYCGRPAGEVDHVIPVAAGGTNTSHNLVAACQACNRRKGAKPRP